MRNLLDEISVVFQVGEDFVEHFERELKNYEVQVRHGGSKLLEQSPRAHFHWSGIGRFVEFCVGLKQPHFVLLLETSRLKFSYGDLEKFHYVETTG